MGLTVLSSKTFAPTCKADGLWLHSPYDPEREADRFALSSLGSSKPSHVLLLEPCLGYLAASVRRLLPRARIVCLHYSAFFQDKQRCSPNASWYPGTGPGLDAFLESAVDEDAIAGVAVLEWEPATRAFPLEAAAAKRAVRASLDRLNASSATVKAFGKRWIANACASFLLVERALSPRAGSFPVVVAAAGPSLNSALAALSERRARFATVAVSSAFEACRSAGIEPDIVVSTDGGFWSRALLYPASRRPAALASPLTALPSACLYRSSSLLLLDQGSFVEADLMPLLGGGLRLPPHGTVSGTALHLASRLTDGPIIAAGLDLASYGDLSHARPHGFDAFASRGSFRLAPLERTVWSRGAAGTPDKLPEAPWRTSRVLDDYASSLPMDFRHLAGRLFRLYPSPQRLTGFGKIEAADLEGLLQRRGAGPWLSLDEAPLSDAAGRAAVLSERIARWRGTVSEAARGMGEGRAPSSPAVAELLRSVDLVDYAAARRAILAGGDPAPAAKDLALRGDSFFASLERRFSS